MGCDWVKFDDKQDLFEVALSPDGVIGDGSDKKCKIFDSRDCKTCACDYYVRYSEDNGASWLGMSFEGVPGLGGTGCPAGGVGTTTVEQTIDFLQEYYIDEGYCGCIVKENCDWVKFDDKQDLFEVALSPDGVIGDGSDKKCKIFDSRDCKTCACDYYVRYSEDNGASWLGMSFEGVPGLGGTGCPAGGVGTTTVEQTIDFLQEYYIDEGYCGCSGENVCLDDGCSKLKEGECMDSKKCITDLSMSKGYACRKDLCKGIDCTCKFKTNIKENQNLIKDVKSLTPKCIDVGCKNLKEGECMASNDCISYTSMFKDYACGKELCDGSDCVCKYKSPSFEGSDKKNKEKVSTKKMVETKVK